MQSKTGQDERAEAKSKYHFHYYFLTRRGYDAINCTICDVVESTVTKKLAEVVLLQVEKISKGATNYFTGL